MAIIPLLLCLHPASARAEGDGSAQQAPIRYGVALSYAERCDSGEDLGLAQGWGFIQWGHDVLWNNPALQGLYFKAEVSAGLSLWPDHRGLASAGLMLQYYCDAMSTAGFRPYVEAGLHGIYTDFRMSGQGLRFNFSPQAGVGFDFGRNLDYFLAFRFQHISNAELHHDNDGFNTMLCMVGLYF